MHRSSVDAEGLRAMAAAMGVTVTEHHGGVKGFYAHDYHVISLRDDLTYTECRCTLAHELGHAVRGDRPPTNRHDEHAADLYAARLLISQPEYVLAERMYGPHAPAIAHELSVTVHLLTIWQNDYQARRYGALSTPA